MFIQKVLLLIFSVGVAHASEFGTSVAMHSMGKETYYVEGHISGFGSVDLLVDTGSSYMTINRETLSALRAEGRATYIKELSGVMADGRRERVPLYSIAEVNIGGECLLKDVEAAVFPGSTRQILGLSALKLRAPFAFYTDPPTLMLSNCGTS